MVGILVLLVMILWRMLLVSHVAVVVGALELVLVGLCGTWAAWRIVQRWLARDWTINGFEIYVLLLILLPLVSAVGARQTFGQPFVWGIIAFKDYYLILGVLAISHWLRMGWVSLRQLEQAMLIMAWICLVYFYFATLFINPAAYKDTGLAGANEIKGGAVYYRFNMGAIYFGAIYYTARAFMRARWVDLVSAMLFAAYVVVFRLDRTSMAVTVIAMVGVALWHVPLKRIVQAAMVAVLPTIFAVMLFFLFAPSKVDQYRNMFMDAVHTMAGDADGAAEVSVRTYEMAIANREVAKHPWVGSGRISKSWNELGYDKFFGFFYPADVGWLGLAFIYGYPGMLLLYLMYPIGFIYMLRVKGERDNVLFATLQFLLLALFLDALTNGQLTLTTAQPLLVVALLHFLQRRPQATKEQAIGAPPPVPVQRR